MQKIVGDRIRPEGKQDPFGVERAKAALEISYGMIDRDLAMNAWATGVAFSMADCAAAPALFYANKVLPIGERFPHTAAYLNRLLGRPSMMRVLKEAEPYFKFFPA
jgi:glutathione S-transferase